MGLSESKPLCTFEKVVFLKQMKVMKEIFVVIASYDDIIQKFSSPPARLPKYPQFSQVTQELLFTMKDISIPQLAEISAMVPNAFAVFTLVNEKFQVDYETAENADQRKEKLVMMSKILWVMLNYFSSNIHSTCESQAN